MKLCYEYVSSEMPFKVHRKVRWSECDPAGVVYAGRFSDYLLDACGLFFCHLGYGHGQRGEDDENIGLPAKYISLTFIASLYPEDIFETEIRVAEIRNRTFDLIATARLTNGKTAFEGKCSPICINPDIRKSILIPSGLRSALAPYHISEEPTK